MAWREIHRRLLDSLHRELRAHWGHISKIEGGLGISEGYLSRMCQGHESFKLRLFLQTIDAMGPEPCAFFARALELDPEPEDTLRQLESAGDGDRAFRRMASATLELEAAEPPPAHRGAIATAGNVEEFAACSGQEQLRRLSNPAYRSHAFARACLTHLDTLRYDNAELAARFASRVAVRLVPALPGPRDKRLALQCLALGVFGSARRQKGRFAAAASALRLALELSRRTGLQEDRGNLLLRASYLLKDFGRLNAALEFLNEALAIFVRLGSRWDVGRALVDQGMMRSALGDFEDAVLDLEQALMHLAGSEGFLSRHHLSAYQFAAYAYEQLGKIGEAHACLERGSKAFPPDNAVDAAKLQWLHGRLAFRHGELERAEALLRAAGIVLATTQFPGKEALLTLDLIDVLLVQGRADEAADLAAGTAPLLFRFQDNRMAEAAILDLVRAAAEGRLREGVVRHVRSRLEGEHAGQRPHVADLLPDRKIPEP